MSKKKKKETPKIPEPQQATPEKVTVPEKPFSVEDYLNLNNQVMQQQMNYAPQIMDLLNLSAEKNAATRLKLNQQYSLPLAELKNQQLEAVAPEFMQLNRQLGGTVSAGLNFQDPAAQSIMQDLASGRNLGEGLTREVQQAIRGAQSARGNVLGAAPTAQEAMGVGQTAESLYQQRLSNATNLYQQRTGNAQAFLSGRQPTDLWGALNATEAYSPSSSFVDQSLGLNVSNTVAGSQASYNSATVSAGNAYNQALIDAANVNNQGAQTQYSNQWDQYLYKQALAAGILSQPGSGGSAGGTMGTVGTALSGAGSLLGAASSTGLLATAGTAVAGIGTALAGGAAAVGGGIAAGASAIGAAVSAAGAAICWLARAAIPDEWTDFRRYLFTRAPDELRMAYIHNARRLAMTLNALDRVRIAKELLSLLHDDSTNHEITARIAPLLVARLVGNSN